MGSAQRGAHAAPGANGQVAGASMDRGRAASRPQGHTLPVEVQREHLVYPGKHSRRYYPAVAPLLWLARKRRTCRDDDGPSVRARVGHGCDQMIGNSRRVAAIDKLDVDAQEGEARAMRCFPPFRRLCARRQLQPTLTAVRWLRCCALVRKSHGVY